MVVTLDPSTSVANVEQLFIDLPLTCTTHAPHWLVSQPTCVPVKFKLSLKKLIKVYGLEPLC